VVVVGADIWDGTGPELNGFKNTTGITFPLLLNAGLATGGNLASAYVDRDNYVIFDQLGIERFSARQQGYSYGAALDVPRMRTLVDSLLSLSLGVVDPNGAVAAAQLVASPNPFRALTRIDAAIPNADGTPTEISVLDLSGRRIATLSVAAQGAGRVRASWNGTDGEGRALPPGVYLIRAISGATHVTRRVVLLR
jgi:FlgD Ig-like domain